ncbi:MAG: DUF2179 domain-containing protein [Anaerolineae bacterium]|nr:DUF2179 domain-containing protein [Anaerolineae bacterium]
MGFASSGFIQAGVFDWYSWVILPVIIFFARVCDVTLGTVRIIFVSRGRRSLAPLLGFFEVLIWIVVIGQLVQHLHSLTAYLCYAGGFAAGNFVGMWMEDRLALGTFVLRVIVQENGELLAQTIHEAGFGVTTIDGLGSAGPVKVVYTIVKRRHVNQVLSIIHALASNAFVTIEEARSIEKGIFPTALSAQHQSFPGRKSK